MEQHTERRTERRRERRTERRTERLLLRGWRDDDLDALAELDGDPLVMRFIRDGSTRTREQTAGTLDRLRQQWRDQGFGLFAAEVVETGELAGWVGLAVPNFLPEVLPAVEIGWRLRPSFWGHGYATEAAREVLAFGFGEIGLDRVVSICHVDNHASSRVMTKLGMTLERRTTTPDNGRPVQVMALTRETHARHTA